MATLVTKKEEQLSTRSWRVLIDSKLDCDLVFVETSAVKQTNPKHGFHVNILGTSNEILKVGKFEIQFSEISKNKMLLSLLTLLHQKMTLKTSV